MHYATQFDEGRLSLPHPFAGHSTGYRRGAHIDREIGAVHTGMGTCELAPGGGIDKHVHSYEEFV